MDNEMQQINQQEYESQLYENDKKECIGKREIFFLILVLILVIAAISYIIL